MRLAFPALVCFTFVAGAPAQNSAIDARAMLDRGTALTGSRPAEAVRLLREALRLDPELPEVQYRLGLAYHAIGDEAEAASELREAVGRTPASAPAHNFLGIALFQLGNVRGALEEFRAAVQLAPKDPNAHFNLGEALARTGESNAAVEELRVAATLAPEDGGLTRLVKVVETRLAASEATIKVEVRQVQVPVIVTDHEGHHVTGLHPADFKVFEDGVEQRLAAFSEESSGAPAVAIPSASAAPASPEAPLAAAKPAPARSSARRTYLICIDTLHASFNNFAAARAALVKLFQQEHSSDSQYVVIALGASAEMLLNVTPDPAAVLAVFQSKRFQKIFLDGQVGGVKAELERFRRDLTDTRDACNLAAVDTMMNAKCAAGLARNTEHAQQIAELDRNLTVGFLRQFRALVAQLSRARDRRTIVLLSDGFQIQPGLEAYSVMDAYFPFASHCLVPPSVYCPPGNLISAGRLQDEFEPILKLAAASNITIDTLDSRGLFGQKTFDASSALTPVAVDGAVGRVERSMAAAEGNTLAEMAAATGGTAFHDSNNLLGGLQRAFADGRDYYTLGYVSTNPNLDGKLRAISVQVRGRDVAVNAKRGYWAVPEAQ